MRQRWLKILSMIFALAFVASACGGSDTEGSTDAGNDDTTSGTDDGGDATTTTLDQENSPVTTAPAEDPGPQVGGTVIVGLEAEAAGLRPWEDVFSSPNYNMVNSIFDKLVEQTVDGTYAPYAAESFSGNEDFTEWTLKLRDGMTFTNGDPVNAQTLVDMFPLQQAGAGSAGTVSSSGLVDVVGVDDLTVTYMLSKSNSAFPSLLSRAALGWIFHPGAAADDPDGFANAPIGSGPFMVESRDIDNETILVRNPDYWLEIDGVQLPYLDSLIFRPIPDEGTRLDALSSGTIDAFQTLRQGTIRDARDLGDDIIRLEFQGSNAGGGMFNTAVPPYDDVRVRRGLNMNNEQNAVIAAFGGEGISAPANQWFSVDSPWYSEKAAAVYSSFDQEAGIALLQEYVEDPARSDGKAVGEKISVDLSCPPDPTLIAGMQVIEQLWTATGLVEVELSGFDQPTHIGMAIGEAPDFEGTHGAHCWRFSDDNDPSTSLNAALAPTDVSPLNVSNFFSEEAFTLAQQAIATDDFDERYALYEQINIIINENAPIWYSGSTATMIATDLDIAGLDGWVTPDGTLGVGFPNAEGRWNQVYIKSE